MNVGDTGSVAIPGFTELDGADSHVVTITDTSDAILPSWISMNVAATTISWAPIDNAQARIAPYVVKVKVEDDNFGNSPLG